VTAALGRAVKHAARAADRVRAPAPGLVVLIYHRVGRRAPLEVDLPLALFEEQVEALAAVGRVVTLDAGLDALEAPAPGAAAPVVVTFDDGTADFAEVAMPVLARHRVPVTLYVATQFVDEGRSFPDAGTPLSWAALRDAHATGLVTVGSHTHSHALLDRLPGPATAAELDRSNDLIGEHVGEAPAHFAYPKAVLGSPAAQVEVAARYRSAALAGTRPNPFGRTDPLRLARSPIQLGDGMPFFRAKVAGGMRLEDDLRTVANRWRYRNLTG
jgi:peptidoglycan/xylan/chitin deacetylase (PgdA/CDA1 family)